jgi:hypothetical protein
MNSQTPYLMSFYWHFSVDFQTVFVVADFEEAAAVVGCD